jgi:hypothetical protein
MSRIAVVTARQRGARYQRIVTINREAIDGDIAGGNAKDSILAAVSNDQRLGNADARARDSDVGTLNVYGLIN